MTTAFHKLMILKFTSINHIDLPGPEIGSLQTSTGELISKPTSDSSEDFYSKGPISSVSLLRGFQRDSPGRPSLVRSTACTMHFSVSLESAVLRPSTHPTGA